MKSDLYSYEKSNHNTFLTLTAPLTPRRSHSPEYKVTKEDINNFSDCNHCKQAHPKLVSIIIVCLFLKKFKNLENTR